MYLTYTKCGAKSLLVTGDILADPIKSEKLFKQLQGRPVKMKQNKGILVPTSTENIAIITKFISEHQTHQEIEEEHSDDTNLHDTDKVDKSDKRDNDKTDKRDIRDNDKTDKRDTRDNDTADKRNKRDTRDNDTVDKQDKSDESDSEQSDTDEDRSVSSEDEKIQLSIRRRKKIHRDNKKYELCTEVDSDSEDIISLSRRNRYLTRKLKEYSELLHQVIRENNLKN